MAKKSKPNPLRIDPTRTTTLRRKFVNELKKKFLRIRKAIWDLVVVEDAFGLTDRTSDPFKEDTTADRARRALHRRLSQGNGITIANRRSSVVPTRHSRGSKPRSHVVVNQRWAFNTTPEKVKAFIDWLRTQIASSGLTDAQVLERYALEAMSRGAGRAFDDVNKSAVGSMGISPGDGLNYLAGSRDQFLRSAFNQPIAVEKIQLLAGRSLTDLKGVTDQMATVMSRVLTDGLVRGASPREIARELAKSIGISTSRASTIARTEIIRAHADGQLLALEQLGVEEVGVMVEWSTAGDDAVCELCAELEGVVMKLDEANALIPRHPNCRCAWIPANVGEDKSGQKRTEAAVERAIDKSLDKEETGKETAQYDNPAETGPWAGEDVDISGDRPESTFNYDQSLLTFSRLLAQLRWKNGNGKKR